MSARRSFLAGSVAAAAFGASEVGRAAPALANADADLLEAVARYERIEGEIEALDDWLKIEPLIAKQDALLDRFTLGSPHDLSKTAR